MAYEYYWDGIVFAGQAEMDAYKAQQAADEAARIAQLTVDEVFRQKSVVVNQAADQNLRTQLGALVVGAEKNPDNFEYLVILENGTKGCFGSFVEAKAWGRAQNKVFAVGQIRDWQMFPLSEAEVATRVAAL